MVLIIIISILAIFLIGVILYFFAVAFVKRDEGNVDNLNDSVNKNLEKYKTDIQKGIDYANSKNPIWVETISFDGLRLKARYFNNESDKTILLFHGYRSSALRDFSCAIKMYTELGFNILLCDQRSHGKSEGKLITFGVKESRDVVSWVEYINDVYEPEKIVLDGISMGATTVILACRFSLPENVRAVIADCGFTSPTDIMKKVGRESFGINAGFFLPFLDFACRIIGKFSFINISTVDVLKKSKLPVLFVHGEADGFVPCEMSKTGFSSAPEGSEIITVPEADHGLSFLIDEKGVRRAVESFLCKNL